MSFFSYHTPNKNLKFSPNTSPYSPNTENPSNSPQTPKNPSNNVLIDLTQEDFEITLPIKKEKPKKIEYQLKDPSEEQILAINSLKESNLIINSVAGSGKTTTILHIAKANKNKRILLLTYNSELKRETRQKVLDLKIQNLEVHSFHSFAKKHYHQDCHKDHGITKVLEFDIKPKFLFYYDFVIIDEAQDMKKMFYELNCKMFKDSQSVPFRIVIVGDQKQSIYQFLDSDHRYIAYAEKIFKDFSDEKSWKEVELSTSFRVTKQIADFLNNCILEKPRIFSFKEGPKPQYVICDIYREKPLEMLKHYIYDLHYKPDDIFVLSYSVKSEKTPIRQFANKMTEQNRYFRNQKREDKIIPLYIPTSDDEPLRKEVLDGKVVFSTFHKVKGLERKIIFIIGFDSSYFEFYAKEDFQKTCPNLLYVALTRSSEHLIMFHHEKKNHLPFISQKNLSLFSDYSIKQLRYTPPEDIKDRCQLISVTNLLKYMKAEVFQNSFKMFKAEQLQKKLFKIDIPSFSKQGIGMEEVSDINGVAIVSYCEYNMFHTLSIHKALQNSNFIDNNVDLVTNFKKFPIPEPFDEKKQLVIHKLLHLSNYYVSRINGFTFKLDQIQNYTWINKNDGVFQKAQEVLNGILSKKTEFEVQVKDDVFFNVPEKKLSVSVHGYIDCVDYENKIVWEFKCVESLDDSHYLQLALYSYMFEKKNPGYKYMLLNILTNEIWEITFESSKLKEMTNYIIQEKFKTEIQKMDDEFLNTVETIKSKYQKKIESPQKKLKFDLDE